MNPSKNIRTEIQDIDICGVCKVMPHVLGKELFKFLTTKLFRCICTWKNM